MPARLKDIARDLGVSAVTVSKVLRDHPDISAETKVRVLNRMKEMNYRPNLAARALVTGRTFIVALLVPDLVHPFFAQMAKGLSRELRKQSYNLVISSSEEDAEFEQREIEHLLSRRVDALVIASSQWTSDCFRKIEEQKTPYVLVDRTFPGLAANFVGVDDELAGAMATRHLIEIGCQRIAHIGGPPLSTAAGRLEGFRRALEEHGITPPAEYVTALNRGEEATHECGSAAMCTLLALPQPPDGVFCYNDATALGAMKTILDAGLRIPEDIALVGCGNVHYSEFLRVPLTSVDQGSEQMGEQAAEMVLSLIRNKIALKGQTVLLEPKLVVRDSTRRSFGTGSIV